MSSKIYNVPVAATTTYAAGTQQNPVYNDSFSTAYHKSLSKTPYSLIDYASVGPDYRVLFYAIANKVPTLSNATTASLNALEKMKAQSSQTSSSILDQALKNMQGSTKTTETDNTKTNTDSKTDTNTQSNTI